MSVTAWRVCWYGPNGEYRECDNVAQFEAANAMAKRLGGRLYTISDMGEGCLMVDFAADYRQ